jgi:hypothetical protein
MYENNYIQITAINTVYHIRITINGYGPITNLLHKKNNKMK